MGAVQPCHGPNSTTLFAKCWGAFTIYLHSDSGFRPRASQPHTDFLRLSCTLQPPGDRLYIEAVTTISGAVVSSYICAGLPHLSLFRDLLYMPSPYAIVQHGHAQQ